jgi:hypothetical protein
MKLKIRQLNAEEVRRGWVRIHENSRENMPAGSLIKITCNDKSVRRIVLGSTSKSPVSEGCISMDEPTREELEIKEYRNKEFAFEIIKYRGIRGIFEEICYYCHHPEFSLRFSTRVAFIAVALGFLSLVISVVNVIW